MHTEHQLIVLYRLPIERLSHLHREDELHRRMIEGAVFRAAALTSTATRGISGRSGSATSEPHAVRARQRR